MVSGHSNIGARQSSKVFRCYSIEVLVVYVNLVVAGIAASDYFAYNFGFTAVFKREKALM